MQKHMPEDRETNPNKWRFYFLDQREIDFLETISKHNTITSIVDYTFLS